MIQTQQSAEWHDYAGLLNAAHVARQAEIRALLARLPLEKSQRVLDVPAGDGFFSALIAERLKPGSEVVAVDIDEEALAVVDRRAGHVPPGVHLVSLSGDVFDLPFSDNHFDFIWCAQSLISLAEPDEVPPGPGTIRALREIRRVLRPGGWIGLLEQDALHYVLLPWPAELEWAIHQAQRRGFARMYGRPEQLDVGRRIGRILAEAGFQLERKLSLTADRIGMPHGHEQAFLKEYFEELRKQIQQDLSRKDFQQFERLTDPRSPESFFQDPHFEMTWLEFVLLGRKE